MVRRIFIDGHEGTTGLQIHERLSARGDLELLEIDADRRKDPAARAELLNAADVAILCLPDAAARESVALVANPATCIIDASTAHRTDPQWAYGLAELSAQHRATVRTSRRIANPGCHATGFALAVYPLVAHGIVDAAARLYCLSLTGYSGGGKSLIAAYEEPERLRRAPGASPRLCAPRMYSLGLRHKHLAEMRQVCGLGHPVHFNPVVGPFYKGMAVTVPLPEDALRHHPSPVALREVLAEHYDAEPFVRVAPYEESPELDGGFLDPTVCNDSNRAEIHVFGNGEQLQVTVVLDNLGKGASGAAVQNLNLALGCEETTGLL
jgi:N-acetyl-gamma-glutamyl-phosphate reductase